ncbi:MAG: carbamoyltransferase HypF [Deltaproteobacteria bacterium]
MPDATVMRLKVVVRGAVQGVGFRPFVYRLATRMELSGWVVNSSQGVFIEVEGAKPMLDSFLIALNSQKPPRAIIQSLESSFLDAAGYNGFEIRLSADSGAKTALILPDIATCAECRAEILDPADRRFDYPFTNCTNCGPRFTIIEEIPYDRQNTSMKSFPMCADCRREYENPLERRFHAEPVACPACGPRVELWTAEGEVIAEQRDAVIQASHALRRGKIIAVKGIGGFHLMVNAGDERAVSRLRERKRREEKPFALMFPSMESVRDACEVSAAEQMMLLSAESPIVILSRRACAAASIAPNVAPRNPYLGVMLPYSPLHIILMRELGFPVVATSANLSDEPIVSDEREAPIRLQGIPDLLLVHDRAIVRRADDSIVRVVAGVGQVMRRSRGYAPLPVSIRRPAGESMAKILAVGAHLKNTVAISAGGDVFISQHIGDLETEDAYTAFLRVIEDFRRLYDFEPEAVACDMHPDYLSTKYAKTLDIPLVHVQHHHAHVAACMAENELEGEVLGICWDGTGYGGDGTVWGGEFLRADYESFERLAHFRTFRLPGGEMAVREPRRAALGMLFEIFGEGVLGMSDIALIRSFSREELAVFMRMLERGVNSPVTSSAGRIFDAVSALAGLRLRAGFEGQAAAELEYAAADGVERSYPFEIARKAASPAIVDWMPTVLAILDDARRGAAASQVSAKFHNTLARIVVDAARLFNLERVVLSGGVFQNRYLTERVCRILCEGGFRPYIHQRVPANDGGIALGQVAVASAVLARGEVRGGKQIKTGVPGEVKGDEYKNSREVAAT